MSLILVIALCLGEGPPPLRDRAAADANDFICGSRCVQHVLEHYGQNVELIDLVRELQGPSVDRPADLARLSWPDPIIVHFARGSAANGHFAVCLSESAVAGTAQLWDGLRGHSTTSLGDLSQHASGTLLLTSAYPIAPSAEPFARMSRRDVVVFLLAAAVATACLLLTKRIQGAPAFLERIAMYNERARLKNGVLLVVTTLAGVATVSGLRPSTVVTRLSDLDCSRIVGGAGAPCYADGTTACPGIPNGCNGDSDDCIGIVVKGQATVNCKANDNQDPNNPTAYDQMQDEYASASGGNAQGSMDTETWEPIYCYHIDTCSALCFPVNGIFFCLEQQQDTGPLIYPTTASGQQCQNGNPVE